MDQSQYLANLTVDYSVNEGVFDGDRASTPLEIARSVELTGRFPVEDVG
jgi:hypothetical protein